VLVTGATHTVYNKLGALHLLVVNDINHIYYLVWFGAMT